MKKLLILDNHSSVVGALLPLLDENDDISYHVFSGDLQSSGDYLQQLKDVDWILAAVGVKDADLDFESLFDAIDEVAPHISHFIMLSYAGVDDELTAPIHYRDVADPTEFIKQQRYAIKIVDESEIPYSIVRMVTLTDGPRTEYDLYNEGVKMPAGQVAASNVADLVFDMLVNQKLINRSVGIVNA